MSCDFFLSFICSNQQGDVPLYDTEPHLHPPTPTSVIKNNAPMNDITTSENTCGFRDVTFKSFICSGGEVEMLDYSACQEESILSSYAQAVKNTYETEDTVISDSLNMQPRGDHEEHPYYNPEIKEVFLVETDAACVDEIPSTTLVSGHLDNKCTNEKDVTWKSFICDGVEVEISDVTRLQDITIPLPKPQLGESLQDCSVNVTNFSDFDQLYQAEHTDHPYCSLENYVPVITTLSESPNGCEKPVRALSDVTLKSFNCTGGEIEISNDTKPVDVTVSLSTNYTATWSQSSSYNVDPSILHGEPDFPNGKDHLDHPYCNPEKYLTPNGNLRTSLETLPYSSEAVDEVKQICLEVTDSQTGIHKDVTCDAFNQDGGEDEKSEVTHLSEKSTPLPEAPAVLSFDDNAIPTDVRQEHVQDEYAQDGCHVGSGHAVVDTPPSSLTNTSFKTSNNESITCKVQEGSKHSLRAEDGILSSVLHKTQSFACSQLVASTVNPTPVEVLQDLENMSKVGYSSASPECSEGKDSALGSTGNGPVLNNSEGKTCEENLTGVLKVLSECPSVASALQFGIFSPAGGRPSLSTQKNNRAPILEQFLGDNSALEVEKSLLAPLNLNPAGLWAEHLESPMPRPLLNSTALGYKLHSGPVAEPDEDVDLKPCVMPQSKVEKPVLDIPVIQDGPLQQQLRQMAEFLMLASGKMGPTAVSASAPLPNIVVPSQRATPVKTHSVCVGTTTVQMVDHSLNTSGQFERKRDFSVTDSCTITDPLLWK